MKTHTLLIQPPAYWGVLKKILTEWAKGTIKIALDFGPESSINRQSYTDYDKWGYPAKQWNIASISAPATNDYFPPELLQPSKLFHDDDEPESIYHQYSQSGFFFDSDYSAAQVRDGKLMVVSNVLLYGLWTVPYAEFSRVHIQDTFTLNPYTNNPSLSKVTATFTPRGGSRRINTPEKRKEFAHYRLRNDGHEKNTCAKTRPPTNRTTDR